MFVLKPVNKSTYFTKLIHEDSYSKYVDVERLSLQFANLPCQFVFNFLKNCTQFAEANVMSAQIWSALLEAPFCRPYLSDQLGSLIFILTLFYTVDKGGPHSSNPNMVQLPAIGRYLTPSFFESAIEVILLCNGKWD